MSQQSQRTHTHTHSAGIARSAGSNLIRVRQACINDDPTYAYMNLYLHFPSRSLMTSHYAKRISGILHEAGRTVAHVLWMQTPSLSIAISLTHTSCGLIERKSEVFPL